MSREIEDGEHPNYCQEMFPNNPWGYFACEPHKPLISHLQTTKAMGAHNLRADAS